MNNAEKFQEVFGYYATEMWAKPENEFLEWINSEYVPIIEVSEKQVANKLKNADDSLLTEDTEMDKEQKSKLESATTNLYDVQLAKDLLGISEEAEKVQLSEETTTNEVDTPTNTPTDDFISRQAAIEALQGRK